MKKLLWGFTVALTASIIILACQKEDSKESTSKDFNVAQAKEWWYGEFIKSAAYSTVDYKSVFAPSQRDGIKATKKYPSWKDGISYKAGVLQFVELPLVYNNQVALFPGSEVLTRNEKIRIASASLNKLLLIKKPDNSTVIRTVSLIPSPEYASAKGYDISNTTLQKPDPQFSGWLLVKDWKETLLKYWQIQNGRIVKKMVLKEKSSLNQNNQLTTIEVCNYVTVEKIGRLCVGNPIGDQPPNTNPEECTEWVEYTYFDQEWLCELVVIEDDPTGECGMGISAEQCACILYNIGCEDGGGGGGENPDPLPPVIINVTDPCLLNGVNDIMGGNYPQSGDFSNLIVELFATNFSAPDALGILNVNQNTQQNFEAETVPLGNGNFYININPNYWDGQFINGQPIVPTREYWASVFLHEIVHTFIVQQNIGTSIATDGLAQHEIMIESWISLMSDFIQDIYGVNEIDAKGLAFEGVSGVLVNGGYTSAQDWDDFIQEHYDVSTQDVLNIVKAYMTGSKGTVCP
jgi:hypothetical protein